MKKQSIRSYLFKTVLLTLAVISIFVVIINAFVTLSFQEEYIFHELEEARNGYGTVVKFNNQLRHITSFDWNKTTDEVVITSSKRDYDYKEEHYELIVDDYISHEEEEGSFRQHSATFFYIADLNDTGVTFYFVDIMGRGMGKELLFMLTLVVVTVFIASIKISNYISKPLDSLSHYSEEIAKKNWNAELDSISNLELSRLGDALVKMKSQLEFADIEERQFLQATSHDLKTPIMVIKGYSQAMIDNMPIKGELSPEQVILKESERLERKVHQLIRLNTVGYSLEHSGHYEIVRVDRILRSLIEKFKVVSNLNFISQLEPFECYGDGESLMIAIENIVENQLRYAKSMISITVVDNVITIENDGADFTEDPETLFDIYKKGKSGQYGLGLAIAKKVIQAHKGTIRAYSKDVGVGFEIILETADE